MNKNVILKDLKAIKELCDSDCPKMASERLSWVIEEIEDPIKKKWYQLW